MKRKNVFKMFAAVAVFAIISVNQIFAQNENYVYKDELINNVLTSRIILKCDGKNTCLVQYKRKEYTYDEFDRIKTRCISHWNSSEDRWDKLLFYSYSYEDGQCLIELSQYIPGTDHFVSKKERRVYAVDASQKLVFSRKYQWDRKSKGWILTDELAIKDGIPLLGEMIAP